MKGFKKNPADKRENWNGVLRYVTGCNPRDTTKLKLVIIHRGSNGLHAHVIRFKS